MARNSATTSLKRLKIKTIIVARPEGETDDQPAIASLCDAADALGITVHQIPVVSGSISDNDVREYSAITSGLDHPVFAYCRSGMRATSLWALSVAKQGQAPDDILRVAKAAGFDLIDLAERFATPIE